MSTAELLKSGKIGVMPTDTMYGLVGSAFNPETVERIYKVRHRTPTKPLIILISSLEDLARFNLVLDEQTAAYLENAWPAPLSVVLPVKGDTFEYLHRGTHTLALRMPQGAKLRSFLTETGPLVAPSANPEGEKPAETILEAKRYFGGLVDFYVDEGVKSAVPSTLIAFEEGRVKILRQGAHVL